MAGTVLVVGAVACAAMLTAGLAGAGAAAVRSQQAAGAADGAALAAADTVSGAVIGVPCERAGRVAAAGGGTIESCVVDGLVATVSVSVPFGPFAATAAARAGPPPGTARQSPRGPVPDAVPGQAAADSPP